MSACEGIPLKTDFRVRPLVLEDEGGRPQTLPMTRVIVIRTATRSGFSRGWR